MSRRILTQREQWPFRCAADETAEGDPTKPQQPAGQPPAGSSPVPTPGQPKIPGMPATPKLPGALGGDYNQWQQGQAGSPLDPPGHPTRGPAQPGDLKNLPSLDAAGITNVDYSHLPQGEPMTGFAPGGGAAGGGGGGSPGGGGAAGGAGGTADGGAGGAAGGGGTPAGGVPSGNLTDALTRAGIDPAMHGLISGFAATEGNNPSGVPTLGFTDGQAGSSLDGHAQALAKQIKDRQSVAGEFPHSGTPQQQAAWMATVVGQQGLKSDWQGAAQPARSDYINRIVQNMPSTGGVGTSGSLNAGTPANPAGMRQVNPSHGQGATTGPDTHGALLPDTQTFKNNLQRQFPQLNNIGGYRQDSMQEHPSGHALDVMTSDPATQKAVRDWALQQPNVNFVLNQQKQWNPDGSTSGMPDRGGPTANHMDHLHINVAGDVTPAPGVERAAPPQTIASLIDCLHPAGH